MLKEKAKIEEEQQKITAEAARRKADVEANLYVLQLERAAVAASAEAAVYESAAEAEEEQVEGLAQITTQDPVQRTNDYVYSHSFAQYAQQQPADSVLPQLTPKDVEHPQPNTSSVPLEAHASPCLARKPHVEDNTNCDILKAEGSRFYPLTRSHASSLSDHAFQNPQTGDLTRYLIRKEMVCSGLLKFDDRPENYWAWKSSFQSVMRDLDLNAREELDLLTKWLGPESSLQAKRIRSVHVHNPAAGVNMLWQRLEDCYGCSEVIEHALLKKLEEFPRISNKDGQRLRELGDVLMEIESAKLGGRLPGLAYLDTARGVNPIVEKLPYSLQERWITQGSRYKEDHHVSFPPFSFFTQFICSHAKTRNDPSFAFSTSTNSTSLKTEKPVRYDKRSPATVRKTEVAAMPVAKCINQERITDNPHDQCPIHNKPHPLSKCRGFRNKHIDERKAYLKEKSICFRCCGSSNHIAKNCKVSVRCIECNSDSHTSALHPGPPPWLVESSKTETEHGGEREDTAAPPVTAKCTEICGKSFRPRSCSKICLVNVYPSSHPEKAERMYAVLDDQSNRSLAKSEFFELFDIRGESFPYMLKTCSGTMEVTGRRASNLTIEAIDGKTQVMLPTLIECDMLPDDRSEIPTPEVAQYYSHLSSIADKIPDIDPSAPILLLLGRDILSLHKVREQHNGPHNAPYAQRLDLGWVIVGEVCLGGAHKPSDVSIFKTNILQNGRSSFLSPCKNNIQVKEKLCVPSQLHQTRCHPEKLGDTVFQRSPDDDMPALSVEDKIFLNIMDKEMYMNNENHWVAPLPFRSPRHPLPNNKEQALKRLRTLQHTLEKKPTMRDHFFAFMQKMFDSDQAEPAPTLKQGEECWYLPIFGVYHPQKPGQIRVVFDSSAQHNGISLNDTLLSGPDLNNSLLGVLLRFRRDQVALSADVQQMFYCFVVRDDHRNYLRFLWHKDNDPNKDITEFRMKVHVFGNSPSPAVAIYGLRRSAEQGEREHGVDAKQFVMRNFYVDDGLTSVSTVAEAISLLRETREMLAECNLKLHKIASNCHQVMEAFPTEDRAKDLKDLELGIDPLPLQRSLGVSWDLETDSFTFQVSREAKPFTRRGILSTVNSLYDPLGFAAPVTMQGKALVRELSAEQCDWDAPLPIDKETQWKTWTDSLTDLEQLRIHRPYVQVSPSLTQKREIHIFSDASMMAIAAVAYLRVVDNCGQSHVGFIIGKSKLAPRPAHTVPRLELCAAVLAVELGELIAKEMDVDLRAVKFFTDSRVVLGYITNTSRRFYLYVSNRVIRIRKSTQPDQWHYVSTERNPADHGTRPIPAALLQHTSWLSGPSFLRHTDTGEEFNASCFELIEPEMDNEVRPQATTYATKVAGKYLGSHRFNRFSTWKSLVRGIATLIHIAKFYSHSACSDTCKGWHYCKKKDISAEFTQAKINIVQCVQQEEFKDEITCMLEGRELPKQSSLRKLSPVIDKDGMIRVGGRVSSADLLDEEKHPLIIPAKHYVSTLLVRHHHIQVAHQGRHLTEGALRSAGLWIIGGKRLVSSVIHKCVTCRKLRGKPEEQKMSDLPMDRLTIDPAFTYVGLDVFGPWSVTSRHTRRNSAESKRWAVMFTCLSTRAVHLEVIESMSTSSFINALRRFLSIRGPVRHLRSDRGTNFIGACKELKISTDDLEIRNYLHGQGCTWTFNAPHSSHMGGAWERMIGIARRILDGMLLRDNIARLSHEVLTTLLAEVMAIMNARPLVDVSTDPEKPEILSPSMLLTQKASITPSPPGDFDLKDLYKSQWRQVQSLAETFWKRWRHEYLCTLQTRKKWQGEKRNLQEGDIVLLKDNEVKRSEWPVGQIVKTVPSKDGKVRKVEVKIFKQGTVRVYLRPVSEVVLLLATTD
ncbi:uncharacterized protein LOC143497110 [Brachyhypopomus gauderio]|uniref:uncharacterized protein LOC143497110 n=1 Tax=Brachyhypopomus gauderio TaxID=698409 RepID=UPI0040430E16